MRSRRGMGTVPAGISSGAAATWLPPPHKGVWLVAPEKFLPFLPVSASRVAMLAAPTAGLSFRTPPAP